jgi:hypothetical protein
LIVLGRTLRCIACSAQLVRLPALGALLHWCGRGVLALQCRTSDCAWTSGDSTRASFAAASNLSLSHPMGTVSLRRSDLGIVNYLRVLYWTHDTIVAEVPEGVGAGFTLVVSVGLTHSPELEFGFRRAPDFDEAPIEAEAPVLVSYAAPVVTSVVSITQDEMNGSPMTGTAGGDVIEVRGDNFGVNITEYSIPGADGSLIATGAPRPAVHVCDRGVGWSELCDVCIIRQFNHTYIACVVPAGVGAVKYIRVTVMGQSNNASEPGAAFSYHGPVIEALSTYDVNTGASFAGVYEYITVTGRHFGSPELQARLSNVSTITMLRCVLLPLNSAGAWCFWLVWCVSGAECVLRVACVPVSWSVQRAGGRT